MTNQTSMPGLGPVVDYQMRGNLALPEDVRAYVLGGQGIVTVQSRRSTEHRTFRLDRPHRGAGRELDTIVVHALVGPDEWIFVGQLRCSDASGSALAAWGFEGLPSWGGIHEQASWIFARIGDGLPRTAQVLEQADVFHEGICGRCGRGLTHPDSIERGLGPICATYVAEGE